jgi:hypothetical protein
MNRSRWILWAWLLMVSAGCKEQDPLAKAPQATEGARAADPCGDLKKQVREVLKLPAPRCQKDEECHCYPAVVDCGGVAHRTTVTRLHTLVRLYRLARCPRPKCLAAPTCNPSCVAGKCVQAASAGILAEPMLYAQGAPGGV